MRCGGEKYVFKSLGPKLLPPLEVAQGAVGPLAKQAPEARAAPTSSFTHQFI